MSKVWRLTIEKNTSMCVTICGDHAVLLSQIVGWVDYQQEKSDKQQQPESIGGEYIHPDGELVRVINGHCDSVDRSSSIIAYRLCDVTGMVLLEM